MQVFVLENLTPQLYEYDNIYLSIVTVIRKVKLSQNWVEIKLN